MGPAAGEDDQAAAYGQIATPKSPTSDDYPRLTDDEQSCPLEGALRQKLVEQVDLEILLKHREYHLVQKEMHKVMTQLETMEKLHSDPHYAEYLQSLVLLKKDVLDHKESKASVQHQQASQESGYNLRKSSKEHERAVHRTSYGGLRPVWDAQGNKICVHKRSDGVIVRIDCPKCGRTDFGSAQGFLNHARLAHSIEYKSQDHAALCCGSLLPDADQDQVGLNSIALLKESGADPNRNLAPGVSIEDQNGNKKRRKLSTAKGGYLEKLFVEKSKESDSNFKALVEDVTKKEIIDDDGDLDQQQPSEPSDGKKKKMGHNRRKSRGGLSAVTFEEHVEVYEPRNAGQSSQCDNASFSPNVEYEIPPVEGLTPAQRRRFPSISEPLRTRSRSRQNSS